MDIAEYKRIIVRLRPSLLAVARNITANNEDAEDLVQDVCLKIWHQRDRFEQFNNLEAYSIAMVKHLSIDKIRNRRSMVGEGALLTQESEALLPDSILEEKEASRWKPINSRHGRSKRLSTTGSLRRGTTSSQGRRSGSTGISSSRSEKRGRSPSSIWREERIPRR